MGDAETSFAGVTPKKKKIETFCHWERPRSQLYTYNYDYGSYYYQPMIGKKFIHIKKHSKL